MFLQNFASTLNHFKRLARNEILLNIVHNDCRQQNSGKRFQLASRKCGKRWKVN